MPLPGSQFLHRAFAVIPNLITNVCTLIRDDLAVKLQDAEKRTSEVLQQTLWALSILVVVARYSSTDAVNAILQSGVIEILPTLSSDPLLTLTCVQIFDIIADHREGLLKVSQEENISTLLTILTNASSVLSSFEDRNAAAAAATPAAAAPAKGKAPATPAIEPTDNKDNSGDSSSVRISLATLKLISRIFTSLIKSETAALTEDVITQSVEAVCASVKYSSACVLAQEIGTAPFDIDLTDTVDTVCIYLGILGQVAPQYRRIACQAGAVNTLLSVMQRSVAIIGSYYEGDGQEDVEENKRISKTLWDRKLANLRRAAVQAILWLVTEKKSAVLAAGGTAAAAAAASEGLAVNVDIRNIEGDSEEVKENEPASDSTLEMAQPSSSEEIKSANSTIIRWNSCDNFVTDESLFLANAQDSVPSVSLASLHSTISGSDVDLGNRTMRLLCAILLGASDKPAFAEAIQLNGESLDHISQMVYNRCISLTASIHERRQKEKIDLENAKLEAEKQAAAAALETTAEGENVEPNVTVEAPVDASSSSSSSNLEESTVMNSIVQSTDSFVDPWIPTEYEALYQALILLEIVLQSNASNVNIMATKERIEAFSQLLYLSGPTGSGGTKNDWISEQVVSLFDPRSCPWTFPSTASSEAVNLFAQVSPECVLLRPLMLRILTIIASADAKYRTFGDAENVSVPTAPLVPLPACESPCLEGSLTVCYVCADVCCDILLTDVEYAIIDGNLTAQPNLNHFKLNPLVLDASLELMGAMASSGARGLFGMIESVAKYGFDPQNQGGGVVVEFASMMKLKYFLQQSLNANAAISGADTPDESLIGLQHSWTRPQFYDEMFPTVDDALCTNVTRLTGTPQVWPLITVCGCLLGVVSSQLTPSTSAALAISALKNVTSSSVFTDVTQPVINDCMCTVFVGLGGVIKVSGAVGRFGTAANDSVGKDLLMYVIARGQCRENFWTSYATRESEEAGANAAAEDIDPKTGKPKPKGTPAAAPPAKGAAAPSQASGSASIVADIVYNVAPSNEHVDPNRGPTNQVWTALLGVMSNDLHANSDLSSPLTCVIQSSLPDVALQLISHGAIINSPDARGLTPLMYALLMGDGVVVDSLLAGGADVNALDSVGNPVLKYASLTLNKADIDRVLSGPIGQASSYSAHVFGSSVLLDNVLKTNVDTVVSDADGNSPILFCLGLASICVVLGGYSVTVTNDYDRVLSQNSQNIVSTMKSLVSAGSLVNFCNKRGITPIHVAAAHGDCELIRYLIDDAEAAPNAVDIEGFTPMHYVAACCPTRAIEAFDLLGSLSVNHPLEPSSFQDMRTGKSQDDKYLVDIESILSNSFSNLINPPCISKYRMNFVDLLLLQSNESLNVLQLGMCGHMLNIEAFKPFFTSTATDRKEVGKEQKVNRMNFTKHVLNTCKSIGMDTVSFMICSSDSFDMSVLHAASLLFIGRSPRVPGTPAQLRSKRQKYYESAELEILDAIFTNLGAGEALDTICTRPTGVSNIPPEWTPLHATIVADNSELADTLLCHMESASVPLDHRKGFVHLMAQLSSPSEEVVSRIVSACAACKDYNSLLNSWESTSYNARPLHLAVRYNNPTVIKALLVCPQVNPNVRDEGSGMTPVHEACCAAWSWPSELMQAFCVDRLQRLDLLVQDNNGDTCIETVIRSNNASVLADLLQMRRNDVIERVLMIPPLTNANTSDTNNNDNTNDNSSQQEQQPMSILMKLETENMRLARELGVTDSKARRVIIAGMLPSEVSKYCTKIKQQLGTIHVLGSDEEACIESVMKDEGSTLGQQARSFAENGETPPDDLIAKILLSRLEHDDCLANGWLLQGYPRGLDHLKLLSLPTSLEAQNNSDSNVASTATFKDITNFVPDCVILLDSPSSLEGAIERFCDRRTDPLTGIGYKINEAMPEDAEVVDRLEQSDEHTEESVTAAFAEYQSRAKVLRECFPDKIFTIDINTWDGWNKNNNKARTNNNDSEETAPVSTATDDAGDIAVSAIQQMRDEALRQRVDSNPSILSQLKQSNLLLKNLIVSMQDAGVIGRDSHAHVCYYEGLLFDRFCLGRDDI